MRVLVVSHIYPNPVNPVVGIFVHDQVKALISLGIGVHVVSPYPWIPWPISRLSQKWRLLAQVPQEAEIEGIRVYYPRYLHFPHKLLLRSLGKRMFMGMQRLVEEFWSDKPFSLVHAHAAFPAGLVGKEISEKYGIPLIITIHGADLLITVHKSKAHRAAIGEALGKATFVVTVSTKLKRLACRYFGDDICHRTIVIHNGFNVHRLGDETEVDCAQKVVPGIFRLLTVGFLTPKKGHQYVLRAMAELVSEGFNIQYDIVGDGPERKRLVALTRELGLEDRVNFHGLLPHSQAVAKMKECDVFVMPSWDEGFGVVYLEAMIQGKPVVGSLGEGIEDLVKHGQNGFLVKPQDVTELVRVLRYLVTHPDEIRRVGEEARRSVLDFTWERNAQKYLDLYKKVLEKAQGR